MEVKTFACDICGIHKKDANHWWKIVRVNSDGQPGMLIVEWSITTLEGIEDFEGNVVAHLCGSDHVTQWLSKNIFK